MRTPWEAGVFVYRNDHVLLMHRTDDRYWHVVAGVVEYGEAIADAARRELREESGLIGVELLDLGSPVTYPITQALRQRYDYPADLDAVTVHSFAAAPTISLTTGTAIFPKACCSSPVTTPRRTLLLRSTVAIASRQCRVGFPSAATTSKSSTVVLSISAESSLCRKRRSPCRPTTAASGPQSDHE